MRSQDDDFQSVSYEEIDSDSYESELLNAMAAGRSPDLILLAHDELQPFADKILPIPYGLVSQSSFLNSFIDEGQIFLSAEGETALPFLVDPLVMYWNREMFASAGLAEPPRFWNDFLAIAPKITSLDASSNVKKSAVALGQWQNVAHAKAILSTLFMQAGDRIVMRGQDGTFDAVFGSTPSNAPSNPAESALRFYTEFTNPSKTTYSWNRTLPLSTTAFTAGDVAVYFGFASEYPTIAARNPNLRFGVAKVPQIEGVSSRITFGRLTGLAIPRNSSNPSGAAQIAQKLASSEAISVLASLTGLPPVRRDVKVDTSSNAAMAVFVDSALISRGWVDPGKAETDLIFKTMIESVISGRNDTGAAIGEASRAFDKLVEVPL
jgi:multiple sugar transport system substrate-binding protein